MRTKIGITLAFLLASTAAFGQAFTGPAAIKQPTTINHCVKILATGSSTLTDSGVCPTTSAVGANPSATIGAAAVNGSAGTFMRSDGAPALPATLPALNGSALTSLSEANLVQPPGKPYFYAQLNNSGTGQSVTTSTITKITFDQVNSDSGSYWDGTNFQYKPLVAGMYEICVSAQANAAAFSAGQNARLYISKNGIAGGGGTIVGAQAPTIATGTTADAGSYCVPASMNGSTDTLEVDINLIGTTPVVAGSSVPYTYVYIKRTGPT